MAERYNGRCLCGEVTFEVGEFGNAGHCHCSMCRQFHGAAYATIVSVPKAHFRWLTGEDLLKGYTAENGTTRTFCQNCGSSLAFASPKASDDMVQIAMGALDGPVPVSPSAHIVVGSAAHWVVIEDDLPQYEAGGSSRRLK